ncbi:Ras family protein [Cooperia oncophora]
MRWDRFTTEAAKERYLFSISLISVPSNGFAKVWLKELQRALGDSVVLMIVGNKFDLARNRTVTIEEAQEYASSAGAMYEETSAKENVGIENAFERLCKGER